MNKTAAVNYFIPPGGYLWRWADDGSAIEWLDDTVCLWMELHALLNYLAPHGLPPLGSIVMLLMACQQKAAVAYDNARRSSSGAHHEATPTSRRLLMRLQKVLDHVQDLPAELRTGLSARAHLLRTLFDGVQNRRPADLSRSLLEQADIWGIEALAEDKPNVTGSARLLQDLKAIAAIHETCDLSGLESLLRTGLDDVQLQPAPIPEPLPGPGDSSLPLLRQLELHRDTELSALAGLARRMVAMFSLPRPAGHPQELPVGGISDITNRGPLDRLLPGELAYDDLTLSARLANNEALYYRRDTPPDEPATGRVLLLDTGIHLWGTPRVFTLAAALGLQAGAPEGESVRVFRREGRCFQPIALHSVAAVRDYLTFLHPEPDPEAALCAFQPDESPALRPDVFLLTVPWQRESLHRALHDLALRIAECGGRFYILTVTRTGALTLSLRSTAGTRILAQGRIDPDTIFPHPNMVEKPAPSTKRKLFNLPAAAGHLGFYQEQPLPLRLPLDYQEGILMAAPVSAGFDSAGNLIIRAKGGSWELPCPSILWKSTPKSMLAAVRPFTALSEPGDDDTPPAPAFYAAEWNLDCRLLFDTRGILHIVYHDMHGFVEIAVLCLLDKATAAWVRHWPQGKQHLGAKKWFQPEVEGQPVVNLTPLMQRFSAMAKNSHPRG